MQRPKRPGRYHHHDDGCKCIYPPCTGPLEDLPRPGTPTIDPLLHHIRWATGRQAMRPRPVFRRCPRLGRPIRNDDGMNQNGQQTIGNVELLEVSMNGPVRFIYQQDAQPPRPGPPPPPPPPGDAQNDPIPGPSRPAGFIGNTSDVISRLLSVMECPVCFEYVSPPILQCHEGHLICSGCRDRLDLCPKCRQPFADIRARALEQISELVLYPCHNNGCTAQLPLAERRTHELICQYRTYCCILDNCPWSGVKIDIARHMAQSHPDSMVNSNSYELSLHAALKSVKKFVMQCHGEIFYCSMETDSRQECFLGYAMLLGPREDAENFLFELKFKSDIAPFTVVSISRTTLDVSRATMPAHGEFLENYMMVSYSTLQGVFRNNPPNQILPVQLSLIHI